MRPTHCFRGPLPVHTRPSRTPSPQAPRSSPRPVGEPADHGTRGTHQASHRLIGGPMIRTSRPGLGERGITTAEYAVGTAAGAGLAGLLYKLLTGGFGENLLKTLFDHVLSLLGLG